jgi:cytochrome P450
MPAFTPEAINRSLPQLELVVSEWLGRWEAAGEPVRAWDSFKALTFDFIMRVSPWVQVQVHY